jgi:beta-galactosidase
LKKPDIHLRSQDPEFIAATSAWFKEVGHVLGSMQVTKGGPILMAQVENEYGSFGKDAEYLGKVRQALIDGGFDIPLFACNPAGALRNGFRDDLFQVVNFGRDAKTSFAKLREVQPRGPLMCGEFYPGWFDTWGAPHHLGNTKQYLADLEYMLKTRASFSLYMVHGGTTPGMWTGTDRPFKPDTNSYDYDAPVSEAGWIGEKFERTRALIAKYLEPGQTLPAPPAPLPVKAIPPFTLTQTAPVFANLPEPILGAAPCSMESYDQGHGCTVYRTELPAGPAATLQVDHANDFAWVFIDGKQVGFMDRRSRLYSAKVPERAKPAQLDILVEAMGHVNFGNELHDRKGLQGPVKLVNGRGEATLLNGNWKAYPLRLDSSMLGGLKWGSGSASGPTFWRGTFDVAKPADTFLDLRTWGKGVVWINGRCLARFWNIGPTQTAYLPGAWLKAGHNEVVILDLLGPAQPTLAGLEKPILDLRRPELDFVGQVSGPVLSLEGQNPVLVGAFPPGPEVQEVKFTKPITGKQFCIETLSAHDGGPFAAIAELDLLDPAGDSISHLAWKIAYADSQEQTAEDGAASNAIDGQTTSYWHTAWKATQPNHPHRLVIDLGSETVVAGFRYTPRAGAGNVTGRIKDYRIYLSDTLVKNSSK